MRPLPAEGSRYPLSSDPDIAAPTPKSLSPPYSTSWRAWGSDADRTVNLPLSAARSLLPLSNPLRSQHHKEITGPFAFIGVILSGRMSRRYGEAWLDFRQQLIRSLIHANFHLLGLQWPFVKVQNIFHPGDEFFIYGRDAPPPLNPRLDLVFLKPFGPSRGIYHPLCPTPLTGPPAAAESTAGVPREGDFEPGQ